MKPTTPRGTRTREISMPLGRRHDSTTVPTGSGSAAIWRRPLAISSIRASLSVRRSRKARVRPLVRARSKSARLAPSRADVFSSRARAICASASSFTRVPHTASAWAAARAARAFDSTSCLTSIPAPVCIRGERPAAPPRHPPNGTALGLPLALQNDEIVAVDDFVEALVAEPRHDVTRLGAADPAQLAGVEVDEPARELPAVPHERHHLARREVALDVHHARGQQALSMMS